VSPPHSQNTSDQQNCFKTETQFDFFRRSRLQNLVGQVSASIAIVALTWNLANQSTLIFYPIANQTLVQADAISFYSRWTNRQRTCDGLPKFAFELGVIRQTFLGCLFWMDLQATQNLTFVLAVLLVLVACLLGSIVTLGPLKRLNRVSMTCLLLPSALACLWMGHLAISAATLVFIYLVALRGIREVSMTYDELIRLRAESADAANFLEMNNRKLLEVNQRKLLKPIARNSRTS